METILEIKNVRKKFGKKEILKGINLSVKKGEIISVLGPSGCGKSTLLNIIAGILPPDEGSVVIEGKEVSGEKNMVASERRNINMVFQDFALWPHMKARDNILYGLKMKRKGKEEMGKRLSKMVELLHLEGLTDQYPSELSGGQQQRVAIARALITEPAIVLLDEPLCNLDIQLRIEMRTEMAQLFHSLNTTVFHVTHDPSEAFAMADRIVVMNRGVIDQKDTPEECYTSPGTSMVAGLLGAGNCLEKGSLYSADDKTCQIQMGESRLTGTAFFRGTDTERMRCPGENMKVHRKVILRFRPEECFFSEGTERKKENKDGGNTNRIPVTVVMSTFEGGIYRVKVKTQENEEFCLLHSAFLPEGQTGYAEISPGRLYIYEKDCD